MGTTTTTRLRIVRARLSAPPGGGAEFYTSNRESIADAISQGWRLRRIWFLPADPDRLAALVAAERAKRAA